LIRFLRQSALAIVLLLAASASTAQELDVFEISDFMDPRIRGAEFDKAGNRALEPGSDFRIWRAAMGGVMNYDWRTRPSDTDLKFLHVVGSYYSGLYQGNVKLTALQGSASTTMPRYRLTTQLARYRLTKIHDPLTKSIEKDSGRVLITTSFEQSSICGSSNNRSAARRACDTHTDYEIGAQLDTSVQLPRDRSVTGSVIMAFRNTAEDGPVFRGTYVNRLIDKSFDRYRVGTAFDVSVERASSSWKMGAVRVGVSYAIDIGGGMAANVAWTPTFVITEPGRRLHHELAFFVDRTIYSRIIPHPPTATHKTR
jgi:hypothetical protein